MEKKLFKVTMFLGCPMVTDNYDVFDYIERLVENRLPPEANLGFEDHFPELMQNSHRAIAQIEELHPKLEFIEGRVRAISLRRPKVSDWFKVC